MVRSLAVHQDLDVRFLSVRLNHNLYYCERRSRCPTLRGVFVLTILLLFCSDRRQKEEVNSLHLYTARSKYLANQGGYDHLDEGSELIVKDPN